MITQTCIANHLKSQQIYQRSPHFHDINEIIYTLNDESSIFLGSHTYKINRGALILVPEGIIHRKSNPTDTIVDTYTIHYPKSLLSSYSTPNTDLTRIFGNTATCIQLPENEIARITRLFQQCIVENTGSFGSDLRQNHYFIDLILELTPYFEVETNASPIKIEENKIVSDLIRYINSHITEHLALDDLADIFYTNKYSLCRIFKKETGFTIIEHINSNRIRLACSILRKGASSSDVGHQVGFSNRSHFIRTFQHFTGVTPGSYARQYRELSNIPIFNNFTPH